MHMHAFETAFVEHNGIHFRIVVIALRSRKIESDIRTEERSSQKSNGRATS